MKILFSVSILILILFSMSKAGVVDRIVAIVNDDVITLSELESVAMPIYKRVLSSEQDQKEKEKIVQEIRKQVLNQLIDNLLVDQEVKRLHITVTDQEVNQFISQIRRDQGLTEKQFLQYLAYQGISLKEYRKHVAEQIKRLKLIQAQVRERIVITDEEIKRYYLEHYAKNEEKYELAAIIIQGEGAKEKVKKAMEELKTGKSFLDVAARYSSIPESGKGLGTFSLDELCPEVRKAVKILKPGEISRPVKVNNSWQIFKLLAKKNDESYEIPLLKGEIQHKLYQEKVDQLFQKWLKDLRKRSYIKILL